MADTGNYLRNIIPETKVAIPLVLCVTIAWYMLETVRQRDMSRIDGSLAVLRAEFNQTNLLVQQNAAMARAAKEAADNLNVKQTKSDVTQEYVARALIDLKVDVKTLLDLRGDVKSITTEIQALRKETK